MSDAGKDDARTGGCQCGGVRYELTGEAAELYACHCLECRKLTASAFSMSLQVRIADFRITGGEPKFWTRPSDKGNTIKCGFCPTCGSRIWHETLGEKEWMTLKPGSLDEPVNYADAIHIWTRRKLPGFEIPEGAEQYPGEPD